MISTARIAEYQTTTLVAFYGQYGDVVLGNFYLHPVTIDGITFNCAEAAYQSYKVRFSIAPQSVRQTDFCSLTGEAAWRLGNQIQIGQTWYENSEKIMTQIIKAKFSNTFLIPHLRQTGNSLIVEHIDRVGKDMFWGDNCDGTGKNMLGKILMQLRYELFNISMPSSNLLSNQEYMQNVANKPFLTTQQRNGAAQNLCIRQGCNRPTYNGQPGEYCGRSCQNNPSLTTQQRNVTAQNLCSKCHINQANLNYSLCQTCFLNTTSNVATCIRQDCNRPTYNGQPDKYCSRSCQNK